MTSLPTDFNRKGTGGKRKMASCVTLGEYWSSWACSRQIVWMKPMIWHGLADEMSVRSG
jgi:hypothetical protein